MGTSGSVRFSLAALSMYEIGTVVNANEQYDDINLKLYYKKSKLFTFNQI